MSNNLIVVAKNNLGVKKFTLLVPTRIVAQTDLQENKGQILVDRECSIISGQQNELNIVIAGALKIVEVKEATYSTLEVDDSLVAVDTLLQFTLFADDQAGAVEQMNTMLDGEFVMHNFKLSDNNLMDCEILLYEFSPQYLIKEDEDKLSKFNQYASVKVALNADVTQQLIDADLEFTTLVDVDSFNLENLEIYVDTMDALVYNSLPISLTHKPDGTGELELSVEIKGIEAFNEEHASTIAEALFTMDSVSISDFKIVYEEYFIETGVKDVEVLDVFVDDLAVAV